jgi:hypothetical protein
LQFWDLFFLDLFWIYEFEWRSYEDRDEGMKEEDEEMMKDEEHDGALLDR